MNLLLCVCKYPVQCIKSLFVCLRNLYAYVCLFDVIYFRYILLNLAMLLRNYINTWKLVISLGERKLFLKESFRSTSFSFDMSAEIFFSFRIIIKRIRTIFIFCSVYNELKYSIFKISQRMIEGHLYIFPLSVCICVPFAYFIS
jgi:hypothetical protein